MLEIRRRLYGDYDPYADFDFQANVVDFQGWNSHHQFFEPIIGGLRPSLILEIGSWKGGSALHMARLSKELGLENEVVCIDTWLGSSEHFLDGGSMRRKNGYPQLYYTFMANVLAEGLQGRITPFPLASESAAVILATFGVKADLIYVDGAHEYAPAYRDATAYWPLLSDKGIMLFDDYGYCDVTKAVATFASENNLPIYSSYGKAMVVKGQFRPTLKLESL
jgi:predicted O-methyltransferase YrrM